MSDALKGFSVRAYNWLTMPSGANLFRLEKAIDSLLVATSVRDPNCMLDIRDLDYTQCVNALISLLFRAELNDTLIHHILSVIQNLSQTPHFQETFQIRFCIHHPLAFLLCKQGLRSKSEVVLKCLEMLEVFTQDLEIHYLEDYMRKLLYLLISEVEHMDSNETACLHILSNLCHTNMPIQNEIKLMPNLKLFYRVLLNKLHEPHHIVKIYCLSILVALTVDCDELGQKIFKASHAIQAFEHSVSCIISEEDSVKVPAGNLLIQLIKSTHFQEYVVQHNSFQSALIKICDLLVKTESLTVKTMALQVLLAVISIPKVSPPLHVLIASEQCFPDLLLHLCHLCLIPSIEKCVLLSFRLLTHLVKILLNCSERGLLEPILQAIPNFVVKAETLTNFLSFGKNYLILKNVLDLFLLLSEDESLRNGITDQLKVNFFQCLAETCVEQYSFHSETKNYQTDVILGVLMLSNLLGAVAPQYNKTTISLLQKPLIVSFLANGLTSKCAERVEQTLNVIIQCQSVLPSLLQIVSQTVATEHSFLCSGRPTQDDSSGSINVFGNCDPDGANLIRSIEQSLETGDVKASEIITLYRPKIASLNCKIKMLEESIQKKDECLQQSESLSTMYRGQVKELESENLVLHSLIRESDKRREMALCQISEIEQQKGNVEKELHHCQKTCKEQLKLIGSLQNSLNDQSMKFDTLSTKLEKLEQDYNNQSETNAMLQQRVVTMKAEQESQMAEIAKLKHEQSELTTLINEKELKIKELNDELDHETETRKDREHDIQKLSEELAHQKAKVKELKDVSASLKDEVLNLEMLCDTKEKSFQEQKKGLQENIQALERELDQQKQRNLQIFQLISVGLNNDFAPSSSSNNSSSVV